MVCNDDHRSHRICGPYKVIPTVTLPSGASIVHIIDESIIIYEDLNPSRGPYHDCRLRIRVVDGQAIRFPQIARNYHYFPYRFRIERSENWSAKKIQHHNYCWLCK